MPKMILMAAVAAATMTAGTASAQSQHGSGYNSGYSRYNDDDGDRRLQRLQLRLDRAASNGRLSRWEERDLRRQLANLYRLEDRFEDNGFSRWEREEFARRTYAFQQRLAAARSNQGYNGRYADSGYANDDRRYDRGYRDYDDD